LETDINIIIEKLIQKCKLGKILKEPKRISGGLLNRMFKVEINKGCFAIKLLNPEVMKREDAKNKHIFAEKVSNIAKENGVNCIPAKIIDNTSIQQIEGYYFLVFDWFDGRVITDEELTDEKCKKVAIELAKIHNIDFGKIKDNCKAYYDINEVDWNYYLDKIDNKQIKNLLEENLERFTFLDRQAIDNLNIISNNMVISHRDLDLPNILWDKDNNPIIIDWESSGLVNPIMEVIDTAWNWSGGQENFDKEKFKLFVNTYKDNGGNLNDYTESLKADYKAKFGWLEYNLKRITGIECIDDEEKKLGKREVVRSINEIKMFDLYRNDMEITN